VILPLGLKLIGDGKISVTGAGGVDGLFPLKGEKTKRTGPPKYEKGPSARLSKERRSIFFCQEKNSSKKVDKKLWAVLRILKKGWSRLFF